MSEVKITQRAKGHWKSILTQLGIDEKLLDGKHRPCPVSGAGEDRFRFSNHQGRGNFFCACNDGKGDGFKLVCCKFGVDFAGAAKMVESVLPQVEPDMVTKERSSEDAQRDLRAVQAKIGKDRSHVLQYLAGRGLDVIDPAAIPLQQARVNYGLRAIGVRDEFDAMVAKVVTPDGAPSTFHLTYLTDGKKARIIGQASGNEKPPERSRVVMTPMRPMAGGAVRLMPMRKDGTLGVAEGIETALSAFALFEVPTWACLNAQMLEAFQPPKDCQRLVIFADNDESFTGQAAAYALAKRCALKWGVPAEVRTPLRAGKDWNDVLLKGA